MSAADVPPPPSRNRVWGCALVAFLLFGALLHHRTLAHLDEQRPAPEESRRTPHDVTLMCNDTQAFSDFLAWFTAELRDGRATVPVSHFDCPVTFLAPAGALQLATDWPAVRIINLFTLAAVFLNAVAAFGFLRAVGATGPVAAAGAIGYMSPNFVLYAQHMGHMNYVQVQWVAFAFWALVEVLRPGSGWLPAVGLGLAMGLQLLSSPAFSLYLAYVGLPVFAVTYLLSARREQRPNLVRLVLQGAVAVAVALAVAYFYLAPRFGAMPEPLRVPPGRGFTWNSFAEWFDPAHPALFLGVPLFALGVLAARWWWWNKTPTGTAMVATLLVCAACMLPAIKGTPYWVLREYAPLFDRMRVPMRFFPFVLLMTLGLVATYLSACATTRRGRWGYTALFLAALAANWLLSPWVYGVTILQPDE